MKLEAGHQLGPYEIVSALGAGGMGEVYRARDTRLGRDVAIKVLPHEVGANPDAYARFEREAKAVAALSHPNILAIHDFGQHDGTAYAVVELLEGETLREALSPGPLPQRKAIDYARQTARGLGAAHDGGVVHRDLKPENLFVTRDGRVKILDFGLARTAAEQSADAREDTPTHTHLTGPGTVLGTINYMSPEQARGEPAGPSSDIFSLGSVLYEMLTGSRPFERETAPETMTAILREDPPEASSADVSPGVQRIVQRCLEKRPEERFHSAVDLAFALETSSGISTGAHRVVDAPPLKKKTNFLWWPIALALVLGLATGAVLVGSLDSAPATQPVKVSPLTFSGYDLNPAASADGRTIVFSSRRAGASGLWVKQLQGGGEGPLTEGLDDLPRFSPDGSGLLFTRSEGERNSIYRVPLIGGEPRKVMDNAFASDWSPDGARIVFVRSNGPDGAVGIANADGSGERILAEFKGTLVASPRWSPDGKTIAVWTTLVNNNVIKVVKLIEVDSGEVRDLAPARPCLSGLAWIGREHLAFTWSEDLLAGVASTPALMSMQNVITGETADLFWTRNTLYTQIGTTVDVAAPGQLVFSTINAAQRLREVRLEGETVEGHRTLTSGSSVDRQPVYSPDGETILFSSNRGGSLDLWTIHTRTGMVVQLTDDAAADWDPAFAPDGEHILWSSDRSGNLEIWMANADGSGARQVSNDGVGAENPGMSPDGKWIVYMTSNPDKTGMWKVRVDGTEPERIFEGSAFIPEFSPNGRYIEFNINAGPNTNRMMVMDFETGETWPFGDLTVTSNYVSSANGRARWFSDGKRIAYVGGAGGQLGVWVQDFIPGRDTTATRRKLVGFEPEWVVETFDISPGDARVVLSRYRPGGTIMLAENVPYVTPPRRD
ncbi:MAG: protein kinase [Acidobacteria bacterium]|nr:protein kinase [Acidobacteriota bacterium]NIM60577.1 protein kinase [Acidobacteriota bacterium]NIO57904.1 protein kinase [Acidobacteriota bacterium]NIQ28907.1 protein kinase [Acidobacteriota bacterium]NIQ83377.1 protein kinase [Acidobacteriota bacterium]